MYNWDIEGKLGSGDSRLYAWTFTFGGAYYFEPIQFKKLRPLVGGALGYKVLDEYFDFPVTGYDNALGLEIFGGLAKDDLEVRLGFTRYRHGEESRQLNYQGSSPEELRLDEIYLELSYKFW